MPPTEPTTPREEAAQADPLLLSLDLREWAGKDVASGGRKDALLGRVEMLRLAPDGGSVEARVRGNRPLPYQVRVEVTQDGLGCHCTCARETKPACRHAVAALEALRFPATSNLLPRSSGERRGRPRVTAGPPPTELSGYWIVGGAERTLTRAERIELARREELSARRVRARRDRFRVAMLDRDGPPRFQVAPQPAGQTESVTLRGRRFAEGACSCLDFARNELGTCVHIERARIWYSRKTKRDLSNLCSVWWSPRSVTDRAPDALAEIRLDIPVEEHPEEIAGFFDAEGRLIAEGGEPVTLRHAEEAIRRARETSLDRGWEWDLDDQVRARLDQAAIESDAAGRLAGISPSDPVWQAVVPRLGLRLHAYQETGVLFLARRGRAFLADDMGLGKTVQAIAAARILRLAVGADRALVVCPASLKHQWRREIELVCEEEALVVEGARAQRIRNYANWKTGFLILNYELVLRDLEAIRAADAQLVILDEAQRIKNWDTKTARAVKQLDSPYAFVLTGTPLENRLLELHSLVEYLNPRALGPRWRLLPFHAVTETSGRIIAYEGLQVLRHRLRDFFLRRDRQTVLDQLPDRTDNTFWTGMTLAQRAPYRRHAATVAALASRGQPLAPRDVRVMLQSLTNMRMLCNGLAQYDWSSFEGRLADPAPPSRNELRALGSPKLEEFARVLDDLLDESEAKVVVFSQWERMLRLARFVVREVLDRRDLRSQVFHGGLSSRARGEMLDAFHIDPEFRVLFSTDAGGLGLNLQAAASVVVNLEVPWNPAVLEQRIGRVHRLGQRRSVQVLHFVTRGAVEERVRQVLESKRALFAGLMDDEVDQIVFDEGMRASFVDRVLDLLA